MCRCPSRSFNFTAPATTLNDENIVVLGDLEETNSQAETAQHQLARFAPDEVVRMITDRPNPPDAKGHLSRPSLRWCTLTTAVNAAQRVTCDVSTSRSFHARSRARDP